MKKTNNDPEMDGKLTDFTDRVLAGKSGQPDSNADEDLRRLEETILRLKRAIPRPEVNKAALKQIDSRLIARLRQERKSTEGSFWRKWLGWNWKYGQSRPQVTAALGLLLLAILAVLSTLILPVSGSPVTATAFANTRAAITAIALTGLILVMLWINRRK